VQSKPSYSRVSELLDNEVKDDTRSDKSGTKDLHILNFSFKKIELKSLQSLNLIIFSELLKTLALLYISFYSPFLYFLLFPCDYRYMFIEKTNFYDNFMNY
jgi:hypothetical protein